MLRFVHLLRLTLMGAGLIGVWYADLRSRQVRDLVLFAESVRQMAVFYDRLVVAGALLLLGSGIWLIVTGYGGWAFLQVPWLVGMVGLFAFEFIAGNTITRLYFRRLRRLAGDALEQGTVSPEQLDHTRRAHQHLPQFNAAILALSAASFLYIGLADLVPGLHRRIGGETGLVQLFLILVGVGTILMLRMHP